MTTDSGDRNPDKTESRLAKHLQALGLEDHGFSDKELAAELKGIAAMKPSPLDLRESAGPRRHGVPATRRRASWYGAGVLAMAAMLAVVLYVRREDDGGYRVKGAAQVVVYTESDGIVKTWDKTTALAEGVRLRVEFKALEEAVAFVGVRDRQGSDLFKPETVWTNRLNLSAGQVAASPGSIELTGADEDETLVTVSCPAAVAPGDFSEFSSLWKKTEVLKQRCAVETLRLR